jgi:hypothetical protein
MAVVDKSRLLCYKGIMKNKLVLENACSYRGADMGRVNSLPEDLTAPCKLHFTQLKWVDGDYDQGGAYWGRTKGDHIFCAWGDVGDVSVRIFIRAFRREDAWYGVDGVLSILPNAKTYR